MKAGVLKPKYDPREYLNSRVFGALPKLAAIPPDFDVGIKPFIKDQQDTDFCTGFTVAAVSEDQEGIELDPLWQFAKTKELMGDLGWGADLREACKSAIKFGSLPKAKSPFNLDKGREFLADWKNWPKELEPFAENHLKKSFFKADGPYDLFDNLRATLWQNRAYGRSIVAGCDWQEYWLIARNGIVPVTVPKGAVTPHALKLRGQKTIEGKPYIVAQLSSGEGVGDKGLFYFPREVINKYFYKSAYFFTDLSKEEAEALNKEKMSLIGKALSLIYEYLDYLKKKVWRI